jgi:hypothetical protein
MIKVHYNEENCLWKDLPSDWELDVQNAFTSKTERETMLDVLRKVSKHKAEIKSFYGATGDFMPEQEDAEEKMNLK